MTHGTTQGLQGRSADTALDPQPLPGTLYEGPPPDGHAFTAGGVAGDLYDPQAVAPPAGAGAVSRGVNEMVSLVTVLYAAFGALLGCSLWFVMGLIFDRNVSVLALLVGGLAGVGASYASNGGSRRVAVAAALVAAFSIVVADFAVSTDVHNGKSLEMSERLEALERFSVDGFADEELRVYYDIKENDWARFDGRARSQVRQLAQRDLDAVGRGLKAPDPMSLGSWAETRATHWTFLVVFFGGVGAAWQFSRGLV